MQGMLAVPLAVLHELQFFLHGLAVLFGRIVTALAFRALEGDDFYRLFL